MGGSFEGVREMIAENVESVKFITHFMDLFRGRDIETLTRIIRDASLARLWPVWPFLNLFQDEGSYDEGHVTQGLYRITKPYDPEYQQVVMKNELPEGKRYF